MEFEGLVCPKCSNSLNEKELAQSLDTNMAQNNPRITQFLNTAKATLDSSDTTATGINAGIKELYQHRFLHILLYETFIFFYKFSNR